MDLMQVRRRLMAQKMIKPNLIPDDDPLNPMQNYTHTSTGSVVYDNVEGAFIYEGNGVAYPRHSGEVQKLYIAPPEGIKVRLFVEYKDIGTTYGLRFTGAISRTVRGGDGVWQKYSDVIDLNPNAYIGGIFYKNIYWRNLRVEKA